MASIKINSLRNKFDMFANIATEYTNIPMISETKLFLHALYHQLSQGVFHID